MALAPGNYERQGPKQDPSRTGRSLPPTGHDKLNPERWDGVAHTIVEKSAIGSYPLVTRFNTGTGERFVLDGELASDRAWYNIGIQDALPTWQWWFRNADGSPATELTVDHDYTQAFDGPTSLRIAVALAAGGPVRLRLFKTALAVLPDRRLGLTYTTGAAGIPSNLRVGLTFQDAPDDVV